MKYWLVYFFEWLLGFYGSFFFYEDVELVFVFKCFIYFYIEFGWIDFIFEVLGVCYFVSYLGDFVNNDFRFKC